MKGCRNCNFAYNKPSTLKDTKKTNGLKKTALIQSVVCFGMVSEVHHPSYTITSLQRSYQVRGNSYKIINLSGFYKVHSAEVEKALGLCL